MNKKIKDAVYGFAVGDALGVPYEFKKRGSFKCSNMIGYGTWDQPEGTWSDDTSMLLATCDSIREKRKIDTYDIMYRFGQWVYKGAYTAHGDCFDIGCTTAKAISNFNRGVHVSECGLSDEMSNGNGSLMRILPLAFVPNVDYETIKEVSALTHAHEISKQKCCEYVDIVKRLLLGQDVETQFKNVKRKEIMSTGYVVDSFNAALWCFENTNNYKDCVLEAVNLGGDTDTIAALAGGLAGIKYGFEDIPTEWVDKLANKDLIDACLF